MLIHHSRCERHCWPLVQVLESLLRKSLASARKNRSHSDWSSCHICQGHMSFAMFCCGAQVIIEGREKQSDGEEKDKDNPTTKNNRQPKSRHALLQVRTISSNMQTKKTSVLVEKKSSKMQCWSNSPSWKRAAPLVASLTLCL